MFIALPLVLCQSWQALNARSAASTYPTIHRIALVPVYYKAPINHTSYFHRSGYFIYFSSSDMSTQFRNILLAGILDCTGFKIIF